jgi:hypothetical protein
MRKISIPLAIKEMQINTSKWHWDFQLTPVTRMTIIKKTNKHWWAFGEQGIHYTVGANVKLWGHYENKYRGSSKTANGQKLHKNMFNIPALEEMQTKTTLKFHLITVRMAIIKSKMNNKCWWRCGKKEPSYIADGDVN